MVVNSLYDLSPSVVSEHLGLEPLRQLASRLHRGWPLTC